MNLYEWLKVLLETHFDRFISARILHYIHLDWHTLIRLLNTALEDQIPQQKVNYLSMRILKDKRRFFKWEDGMFTYKISKNNEYVKLMTNGAKTWLKKKIGKEEKKVCEIAECGIKMFILQVQKMDSKSKKCAEMERHAKSLARVERSDNHTAKRQKLSMSSNADLAPN